MTTDGFIAMNEYSVSVQHVHMPPGARLNSIVSKYKRNGEKGRKTYPPNSKINSAKIANAVVAT